MEGRYTGEGQQVMVRAQEEARALGHGSVGPEHVLLGLLAVEDGTAARALAGLGLDAARGRAEVERIAGRGTRVSHGALPFTPRTRGVSDGALREAMSLGHEEVGTEHVLLALAAEREGVAAKVLETVAHPGVVRDAVLATMQDAPAERPADGPSVRDLPGAVSVRIGEDVRALLRRAAGLALTDGAAELSAEHVRRALDP
jgi:ATP-dependent Clp protease ATP-binding subunit ClpC